MGKRKQVWYERWIPTANTPRIPTVWGGKVAIVRTHSRGTGISPPDKGFICFSSFQINLLCVLFRVDFLTDENKKIGSY